MQVDPTSEVAQDVVLGAGTRVWGFAHLREGVRIGVECVIGRGAYLGTGVLVGDRVKIQNQALLYEPAVVEDGAFIGPGVVLTNDRSPRAVQPDGRPSVRDDWEAVGVTVRAGASIGAGAVCVAPVTIGVWAMVGAGATVVRDVPDFAVVVGTPARRIGWVGRAGHRLLPGPKGLWTCPVTGTRHQETHGRLVEVAARG